MDVFCKIVKGEIPCYKIYEDELCLAFLDVNPVSKGHALVVTKSHCDDVLDCNDELYMHVMMIVKRLSTLIMKRMNAKGMNIVTNAKEVAGQSVPHFHVHMIPRYSEEDGFKAVYNKQEGLDLLQIQHDLTVE